MADSYSISEHIVDAACGRISYLEAGCGPALLYLHGIGSGAQSWRGQLTGFADLRRSIAWNAPGYGGSTHLPVGAPSATDYALVFLSFLDVLEIDRCDIVGHSLGALIAAKVAYLAPDRIRTLTLASCALGHARIDAAERDRLLTSRIADIETLGSHGMAQKRGPRLLSDNASDELRIQIIETMSQVDPHGYSQAARMLSGGDMIGDLTAISDAVRIQIIYGAEDVITPPSANLIAASARPAAKVHPIEGAGHAVYIERLDEFNETLRQFLEDACERR